MAKKNTVKRKQTSRRSNKQSANKNSSLKTRLLNRVKDMSARKRMALFAITFGVIGLLSLFPILADGEIPGRADEIVFEVSQGIGVDMVAKANDGTLTYSQSPFLMRLTGDGTLLCDDGSMATVNRGKLKSSAVRNLYDEVMSEGLFDLPDNSDATATDIAATHKTVKIGNIQHGLHAFTVTDGGNDSRKAAHEKVAEKLMRECAKLPESVEKIQQKDILKAKEKANEKSAVQRVLSFIDQDSSVYASHKTQHGGGGPSSDDSTTDSNSGPSNSNKGGGKKNQGTESTSDGDTSNDTATETNTVDSEVSGQAVIQPGRRPDIARDHYERANAHRATYPISALPRGSCLDEVAYRWSETMANSGNIYHNGNRTADIENICQRNDWELHGENVGVGYDSAGLFQAFLNSTCHHANIDSRPFIMTSTGCAGYASGSYPGQTRHNDSGWGAYITSDGRIFTTQIFVRWSGGSTPATPSTPISYDNSSCSAISASKTTVAPGERFLATVKMYNAGNVTWTMGSGGGYWRLGSSMPRNNATWGVSRANTSGTVAPGGVATFQFYVTAPNYSDGSYGFNWELLREGTYWLADQTPEPDGQSLYPICKMNIAIKKPVTTTTDSGSTSGGTTSGGTTSGGSTTTTTNTADRINIGASLYRGSKIYSANRSVFLMLQTDGNLVLYSDNGTVAKWWSATTTGYRAIMQDDGNFVLYNSGGSAVWHANMGGKGGKFIKIQDDKRMVMYNSSLQAIWGKP